MPPRSLHAFLNHDEAKPKKLWRLVPVLGSLVFVIFYLIAASLYPGGSQADIHSKGFSWMHNYWCNLLNEKALNGESNNARTFGMMGMVILAISLLSFWNLTAELFPRRTRRLIQLSGFLSVAVLLFLPSTHHDSVINVSGFFGLIATGLVYDGIYKNRWRPLFWFGIFNLALIALNNYIYYMSESLYYLPVVQKGTFFSWLVWICLVDIKLYQRSITSLEM